MDWVYDIELRINHASLDSEDIKHISRAVNDWDVVVDARRCDMGAFYPSTSGLPGVFAFPLVTDAPGSFMHSLRDLMPSLEASGDYFRSLAANGGRVEMRVTVHFGVMSGFELDLDMVSRLLGMKIEMKVDYLSCLEPLAV